MTSAPCGRSLTSRVETFEYPSRARQLNLSDPGPEDLRLLEERDRSVEQYLKEAGCPFEYRTRYAKQLRPTAGFERDLEEHDRDIEQFLSTTLSCPFEFPFRWRQLFEAESPDRLFEERDRALEQYLKTCSCGTCAGHAVQRSGAAEVPATSASVNASPSVSDSISTETDDSGVKYLEVPVAGSTGDTLFIAVMTSKDGASPVSGGFSIVEALEGVWQSGTVDLNDSGGSIDRQFSVQAYIYDGSGSVTVGVPWGLGIFEPDVDNVLTFTLPGRFVVGFATESNTNASAGAHTASSGPGLDGGMWLQIVAQFGSTTGLTYDDGGGIYNATDDPFSPPGGTAMDPIDPDNLDHMAVLYLGTDETPPTVTWGGSPDHYFGALTFQVLDYDDFTEVDFGLTGSETAIVAVNGERTIDQSGAVLENLTVESTVQPTNAYWAPSGASVAWVVVNDDAAQDHLIFTQATESDTSPGAPPWGITGQSVSADGSWIPLSVFGRQRAAGGLDADPLYPSAPWVTSASESSGETDVAIATAARFPADAQWSAGLTPDRWDAQYLYIYCQSGEA